jgi:hypothetical protein
MRGASLCTQIKSRRGFGPRRLFFILTCTPHYHMHATRTIREIEKSPDRDFTYTPLKPYSVGLLEGGKYCEKKPKIFNHPEPAPAPITKERWQLERDAISTGRREFPVPGRSARASKRSPWRREGLFRIFIIRAESCELCAMLPGDARLSWATCRNKRSNLQP